MNLYTVHRLRNKQKHKERLIKKMPSVHKLSRLSESFHFKRLNHPCSGINTIAIETIETYGLNLRLTQLIQRFISLIKLKFEIALPFFNGISLVMRT